MSKIIGVTVGTPINPNKISGGGAPADWNASEGEAGHVLNRTHYDSFGNGVVYNGMSRTPIDENMQGVIYLDSDVFADKEYTVIWHSETDKNNTEYKCTSFFFDGGEEDSGCLIGNYGLLFGEEGTGEPFLITVPLNSREATVFALDGSTWCVPSIEGYTNLTTELPKRFIQSHLDEIETKLTQYPIDRQIVFNGSYIYADTHNHTWEELKEIAGKVCRIELRQEAGNFSNAIGTVFPTFYVHEDLKKISAKVVVDGEGDEYFQVFTMDMYENGVERCDVTSVLDEDGMTKALDDRFLESSFSNIYAGAILGVADNGKIIPIDPPQTGIDKNSITLGVHTDGLVYVFVDGTPCGTGISMTAGGDVVGNVDENNVITLTGNLTNGTYTFKYVNVDGSTTTIGTAEVTDGGEEELPYTNQIPISTDKDGSVYGYSTNTYLSSSTGEVGTKNGYETTGFIPVKINDVVRFKNVGFSTNASETGSHRMMFYKADKTFIGFQNVIALQSNHETEFDASGNLTKFVVKVYGTYITSDTAYIRLCCDSITADSIITVNEEIV